MGGIPIIIPLVFGGAYLVLLGLGIWILTTIEKRSLWTSVPFLITAYDKDFTRLHLGQNFYVNQVQPESNDISFTHIREDGRAKTLTDLFYIAVEARHQPLSDSRPDIPGSSLKQIQGLLDRSEVERALIYTDPNDRVIEVFLVDRASVQVLNNKRFRVFAGYDRDFIDSKGFDLHLYKNGKLKAYHLDNY